MRETVLKRLKKKLSPGNVYRRADFTALSSNVDRHLSTLVSEGVLSKLQNGLFYCPEQSTFGDVPPADQELLEAFLKSDEFLVYSPNSFNSLGLGTTQLYNLPVVLNAKRHGLLQLGERDFLFVRRRFVPKQLTKEVLLVELLNNSKWVSEEHDGVLEALSRKLDEYDRAALQKAAKRYGTYSTQRQLNQLYSTDEASLQTAA